MRAWLLQRPRSGDPTCAGMAAATTDTVEPSCYSNGWPNCSIEENSLVFFLNLSLTLWLSAYSLRLQSSLVLRDVGLDQATGQRQPELYEPESTFSPSHACPRATNEPELGSLTSHSKSHCRRGHLVGEVIGWAHGFHKPRLRNLISHNCIKSALLGKICLINALLDVSARSINLDLAKSALLSLFEKDFEVV